MNDQINDQSRECVHHIRNGEVTAVFTSFGWTFLCDPSNTAAVLAFDKTMKETEEHFSTLLLDDTGRLNKFLKAIPESAPDLMEFSEKPLIVWFADVVNIIPEIRDQDGEVPFMLTTDDTLKNIVYKFGKPVLAGFITDNTIQPETALKSAGCVIPLQRKKTKPFEPSIVHFEPGGSIRLIQK